jgi:hypothetical protein
MVSSYNVDAVVTLSEENILFELMSSKYNRYRSGCLLFKFIIPRGEKAIPEVCEVCRIDIWG